MSAGAVGLGFRALRGGAVVVGVALDAGRPRVERSSFLATAAEGDRLSLEPYVIAYEMPRAADGGPSAEIVAAVAEGRRRQEQLAAQGMAKLVGGLREAGHEPVLPALLINRAGWMTDLLEHGLSAPEHPPVMEGLAVREALRFAFGRAGLQAAELDEKSLPERAAEKLRISPGDLEAQLRALGADAGRPWRKEQKLACLAAWVMVAAP